MRLHATPATCHDCLTPPRPRRARPGRTAPSHPHTPRGRAGIADLGMIEMYMYARRHGHGYRVINFAGKGVRWGSGRPDRHPAWSRIPLLWALYTGGKGVELVLQRASECPRQDQWLLYADTDIAIHATGFSVGEIMAGTAVSHDCAVTVL